MQQNLRENLYAELEKETANGQAVSAQILSTMQRRRRKRKEKKREAPPSVESARAAQMMAADFEDEGNYTYERGSIYNGNTLITQPTKALEFYAICGTKDQGLTFLMVYKTLFYVFYLLRYRLLKQAHIYLTTLLTSPTVFLLYFKNG